MALRNSLIRRNHKERSQPANRARLGLLEKHKDYVHRARDYKSKKDRIRKLREKAAFRNKDEFYWGMIKGKTRAGVHIQSRGNEALSNQFVRLLKTQDANYVRTQIAQDEARIVRLKAQLQSLADLIPSASLPTSAKMTAVEEDMDMGMDFDMDALDGFSDVNEDDEEAQEHIEKLRAAGVFISGSESKSQAKSKAKHVPSSGHVVFAETRDEMDSYERHPAFAEASSSKLQPVEDEFVDLGWATPVSRKGKGKSKGQAVETKPVGSSAEEQKRLEAEARKHRDTLLESLLARQERVSQLKQALAQMEQQRILMGKGSAIKKRNAEKIVTGGIAEEDREGGFEIEKGDEKIEWKQKVFKFRAERRK